MTQIKNDSINSVLQVVEVFSTSGFPYLILCHRHCKWKVATIYLPTRTKNNKNICV